MPILNVQVSPQGAIVDVYVQLSFFRIKAMQSAGQKPGNPFRGKALLDTGASSTMIDKQIVQFLKLAQTGTVAIRTPSTGTGSHICSQFDVSLAIVVPPNIHTARLAIPVLESDFSQSSFDVLLGRDVLSQCVMVYNGKADFLSLSF